MARVRKESTDSESFQRLDEVLKIKVNGKTFKLDLGELSDRMVIDANNLDYELEHQSAFYFWIATLSANAQFMAEEEEQAFKMFTSEAVNAMRLEFEEEGGKAPAATIIEAAAKSTDEYRERLENLIETKRIASIFDTIREAVRMRQFTLIERSRRISKDAAAEYEE